MLIRGLRAEVFRTGRRVVRNNFDHSEWAQYLPSEYFGLVSVLFTPLMIDGKRVGPLGLANKAGGFDERDVHIVLAPPKDVCSMSTKPSWRCSGTRIGSL